MNNMNNLWRQVIIDHYKNPRNKGINSGEGFVQAHIKNPSCGDDITIETKVVDGVVKEIHHDGKGCSICCASASVLTEVLHDKSVNEAVNVTTNYLKMVSNNEYDESVDLDEAVVFEGVRDFPARVKCASIAWQAFLKTIDGGKYE